jgi:heme-degrading monooxygenase HmoA
MHAQLTTFIVGAESRQHAEQAAGDARSAAAGQAGFVDISFFYDDRTNELGSYSRWESKEAADAAGKVLTKAVEESLGAALKDQVLNRTVELIGA